MAGLDAAGQVMTEQEGQGPGGIRIYIKKPRTISQPANL